MKNQATASKRQCTNFYLPDDLLLQIFYRLPNFESLARCKSVCKHWLNLITGPGFDARYIASRSIAYLSNTNSSVKRRDKPPLHHHHPHPHVFCIRRHNHMKPVNYPKDSSFRCLDSILSFLPPYEEGHVDSVCINSWCNDLVLCTTVFPKQLELYICNPRTRQYIQLPPPSNRVHKCIAGFTWDPYYVFDRETGQVTLNNTDCGRYCICYAVPSLYPSSTLEMEVLSSESRGVWMKAELRTPHPFDFIRVYDFNPFTYKGMLHFCSSDAIVGFDPYQIIDGVIRGRIIQMPPYDLRGKFNRSVSVGVFGEKLLLVEYHSRILYPVIDDITEVSIKQDTTAYSITVWELENYNNGQWSRKHMIYLHDFASNDSVLSEHIKRGCPNSTLLYIYPNDADVVLLMFRKLLVECNVRRKTLKKVCRSGKYRLAKVYGLAFPWWPSPLPLSI